MDAHEPVHGDGGDGERLLVAVAAKAHEQRLLVKQPDAAAERMNRRPRLERLLDRLRHGDLALLAALATHVQTVVAGIGARAAQIPGPHPTELRGAQPTVAEHPQEGVVALARDRAPVRVAQQIGVVGVGERLRRAGLMAGHPHVLDRVFQAEVPGEHPDHREVHPHGRWRRRTGGATAAGGEVPAVGGDDIGVEIADHGRVAELVGEPVPKGAEDRRVLAASAGRRRPGSDPLGLAK